MEDRTTADERSLIGSARTDQRAGVALPLQDLGCKRNNSTTPQRRPRVPVLLKTLHTVYFSNANKELSVDIYFSYRSVLSALYRHLHTFSS